jgi:hypothetical protein
VGSSRLIGDPPGRAPRSARSREPAQTTNAYVRDEAREAEGSDEQEETPPPAWQREVPLQSEASDGHTDPKDEHDEDRRDQAALCAAHGPE